MEINISNLSDGEHRFDFEEPADEFDIDWLDKDKKVIVDVVLYKMANQFNLDIEVKCGVIFECDRCMENYKTDLITEFDLIYKYEFSGESQIETTEDNLKFITPNTHKINLKEDVRDYIILSTPMKKVPPEEDGICTYCNKNINEITQTDHEEKSNPIWDELKKLKK